MFRRKRSLDNRAEQKLPRPLNNKVENRTMLRA